MNFTLADAAKRAGISRSSIYRLIDEGKLSATTDRRGKKVVELSELLRVFGSVQEDTEEDKTQENKKHKPGNVSRIPGKTGQDTLFSTVQEMEHLRMQLQLKDMELRLKDKELELANERMQDLRQTTAQANQEKEKLLNIIERQTLLLAAPKASKAPVARPKPVPAKKPTPTAKKAATPPAKKVAPAKKLAPVKNASKTTKKIPVASPAKKR